MTVTAGGGGRQERRVDGGHGRDRRAAGTDGRTGGRRWLWGYGGPGEGGDAGQANKKNYYLTKDFTPKSILQPNVG